MTMTGISGHWHLRSLAVSAHARKSGHISDCWKLRTSLFLAFDGEGRPSSASDFIR